VKDEKQIEPAASSAPTSAPPLDRSPFKSDEEYQEALAFRKHQIAAMLRGRLRP